MYCPVCSQEQINEQVRFCSRCGFLLTAVAEVVQNNGVLPNGVEATSIENQESPRRRGVKQGAMIILVCMLLLVPILAVIHLMTKTEPFAVALVAIFGLGLGALRMTYAMLFQSKIGKPKSVNTLTSTNALSGMTLNALPPTSAVPASDYVSPLVRRTTNDLVTPHSVTDPTTKLLENESSSSI